MNLPRSMLLTWRDKVIFITMLSHGKNKRAEGARERKPHHQNAFYYQALAALIAFVLHTRPFTAPPFR
jgi:hypothetical protein